MNQATTILTCSVSGTAKGGRSVLQKLDQRLEFRRSVATGVNDTMSEILFDVDGCYLGSAGVVCRSIGTTCHFATLTNERDLADALGGCGVAAGNGLVIQRFFR